jgi:hypothetical protein
LFCLFPQRLELRGQRLDLRDQSIADLHKLPVVAQPFALGGQRLDLRPQLVVTARKLLKLSMCLVELALVLSPAPLLSSSGGRKISLYLRKLGLLPIQFVLGSPEPSLQALDLPQPLIALSDFGIPVLLGSAKPLLRTYMLIACRSEVTVHIAKPCV